MRSRLGPASAAPAAFAASLVLGWALVLAPSLIRQLEAELQIGDSDIGVYYFSGALAAAAGGLMGGWLLRRAGRLGSFIGATVVGTIGLVLLGGAPGLVVMLVASLFSSGCAALDALSNAAVWDTAPDHNTRTRHLTLLQLCGSAGGCLAPIAIGALLTLGVSWRAIAVSTGLVLLSVVPLARAFPFAPTAAHAATPRGLPMRRARLRDDPGLVWLAVAMMFYAGAELGTSGWVVRFLADAPTAVATAALSLFWGGITVGRLVASHLVGRVEPHVVAVWSAALAAIGITGGALVPLPGAIVCFLLAGLALGPVFPTTLAMAARRRPDRSATVSGAFIAAAVAGGMIYPPVMGFVSSMAGLQVAMVGAGIVELLCAGALIAARRVPVPSLSEVNST